MSKISKMVVRRRMAIASFVSILAVLFGTMVMSYYGTALVGENLLKATGIISPILVCLTGLIVQYAHTSHQHDKINLGVKDDPEG